MWFENVGDAPPVAHRDVIYVNEDIPVIIPLATLLANDTDIDRDPLRVLGWRLTEPFDALIFGGDAGQPLNGTIEYDGNGNLVFTPNRDASQSSGFVYRITDDADGEAEGYVDIIIVPTNDDPTVGQDDGFVTPLDAPLVLRVSDLLKNDFDVEQADHDGDGVIDDDLDNPNRARPTFVGIDGVYDADALALGQRVPRGQAEVVDWNGEKFIVVRFAAGFTGNVAVEYRIADTDGATDTGFAMASVADSYNGLLRGTPKADYLVGTAGADLIQALGGNDFILAGKATTRSRPAMATIASMRVPAMTGSTVAMAPTTSRAATASTRSASKTPISAFAPTSTPASARAAMRRATPISASRRWSARNSPTSSAAMPSTTGLKGSAATTSSRVAAATTPCWAARATIS